MGYIFQLKCVRKCRDGMALGVGRPKESNTDLRTRHPRIRLDIAWSKGTSYVTHSASSCCGFAHTGLRLGWPMKIANDTDAHCKIKKICGRQESNKGSTVIHNAFLPAEVATVSVQVGASNVKNQTSCADPKKFMNFESIFSQKMECSVRTKHFPNLWTVFQKTITSRNIFWKSWTFFKFHFFLKFLIFFEKAIF